VNDARGLLAKIDHTNLKPTATADEIRKLCREAVEYGFAAVCINPYYVRLASKMLKNENVKVCTVIGFPLGATLKEVKSYEAEKSLEEGAAEIDMVMNISAFKSKLYNDVLEDIREVVKKAEKHNALVKVIIECCYLTNEEKIRAAEIVLEAGADYVKTSTGFGPSGATVEDVRLLKETVKNRAGVKAAGGIRTLKDLINMIEAGADRIGTSSGAKIAEEALGQERKMK